MNTATVVRRFEDALRRFVRSRIRNAGDVDDVLQEVLTKVHVGLPAVKDRERLAPWVFRIARNAVVDHLRSKRPERLAVDVPESRPDVSLNREVGSWLAGMMGDLAEPDREAIRLAEIDGLPEKAVASKLGITLTAAKSRIQRARKRLLRVLTDCCHLETDRRGNVIGYVQRGSCSGCR